MLGQPRTTSEVGTSIAAGMVCFAARSVDGLRGPCAALFPGLARVELGCLVAAGPFGAHPSPSPTNVRHLVGASGCGLRPSSGCSPESTTGPWRATHRPAREGLSTPWQARLANLVNLAARRRQAASRLHAGSALATRAAFRGGSGARGSCRRTCSPFCHPDRGPVPGWWALRCRGGRGRRAWGPLSPAGRGSPTATRPPSRRYGGDPVAEERRQPIRDHPARPFSHDKGVAGIGALGFSCPRPGCRRGSRAGRRCQSTKPHCTWAHSGGSPLLLAACCEMGGDLGWVGD